VPESKVRIVTGDTGGSFGMKSPIFNETPLVLLASKLTGRPVKWISTRTEAFLSDAHARDNVTEAELALDKDGNFIAFRVKTFAAIGAYLQLDLLSCSTPARLPGCIAHPRCMSTSQPFSATPTRCAPIAATDGPRPPT
jgi:carbon-monoxide dehydrogenase large subunit